MSEWLRGRTEVSPGDFAALRAETGVSEGYARKLVRESGLVLDPLVEGIRQENFAELERTLLAMPKSVEGRRLVLLAKEHARLSMRSQAADRGRKEEMISWMTVWLETPDLFASWVQLRKRAQAQDWH